jgi:hypothetical protein
MQTPPTNLGRPQHQMDPPDPFYPHHTTGPAALPLMQDGAYSVRGRLETAAPPELVYAVLTDYEGLARVFHNVVHSDVLDVGGQKHLVQVGGAGLAGRISVLSRFWSLNAPARLSGCAQARNGVGRQPCEMRCSVQPCFTPCLSPHESSSGRKVPLCCAVLCCAVAELGMTRC